MNNSSILENVSLHGELNFTSSEIFLDAQYKGNIHSNEGILIIGKKAIVEGFIDVNKIIVEGKIIGKCVTKHIELKKTAEVQADITAHSLQVHEGAQFQGNLEIL